MTALRKVCVLGSMNMDVVISVDAMPQLGETVFARSFKMVSGGKGANQAVAASRLGAQVSMIAAIGHDSHGDLLFQALQSDRIDTEHVRRIEGQPTGMALITVNADGNNSIVVVPGANRCISREDIQLCSELIAESNVLVAQCETPLDATWEAFAIARQHGVVTVLNPAPAVQIPGDLLRLTDILVPNETETHTLTKIRVEDENTAKLAGSHFLQQGVKFVIITLGDQGAALISSSASALLPALPVKAVDTTAAGDGFIGALASQLASCTEDESCFLEIKKAILFANKVSSLVVQKEGAQPSLPTLLEVCEEDEKERRS